jgi:hypothetical protein
MYNVPENAANNKAIKPGVGNNDGLAPTKMVVRTKTITETQKVNTSVLMVYTSLNEKFSYFRVFLFNLLIVL